MSNVPLSGSHILPENVALRLDNAQKQYLPKLKLILNDSKTVVGQILLNGEEKSWTVPDIRAVEHAIAQEVATNAELKVAFDTLAKLVAHHRSVTKLVAPYPAQVSPVRLENNPFAGIDLPVAERLLSAVEDAVSSASLAYVRQWRSGPADVRIAAALAVLRAVTQFDLLDDSMLVALVEAAANPADSLLQGMKCCAYVLKLQWQGEPHSQTILYTPDALAGTILRRLSEEDVRSTFSLGLDSNRTRKQRYAALLCELNECVKDFLASVGIKSCMKDVLGAARCFAYLHMPSTIAAFRSRKFISHAPSIQVWRRLMFGALVTRERTSSRTAAASEDELTSLDAEISDISQPYPEWLHDMRDAYKAGSPQRVLSALLAAREKCGPAGRRVIDYSISLMSTCKISTTERYSLLIARRIGTRSVERKGDVFCEVDPVTLTIEEIEDLFRDALDDDWDDATIVSAEQFSRPNKRVTIEALLSFHAHLRHLGVGPLRELAPVLRHRGLQAVDANFITVDDFLRVLRRISGPNGISNPYLRSVLRLIIILAFRCGLRRGEVSFLRVQDIDAADHLHVRTYRDHKVKTLHSNRALPLHPLCEDDELTELKDFADGRRRAPHSDPNRILLFSREDDASMPLDFDRLLEQARAVGRVTLKDETLRFHHYRHSALTLLPAKLFGMDGFVREFLPNHPETLKWMKGGDQLRRELFGNGVTTDLYLQAVAHLAGHSTCRTGCESYIHSLSWWGL